MHCNRMVDAFGKHAVAVVATLAVAVVAVVFVRSLLECHETAVCHSIADAWHSAGNLWCLPGDYHVVAVHVAQSIRICYK